MQLVDKQKLAQSKQYTLSNYKSHVLCKMAMTNGHKYISALTHDKRIVKFSFRNEWNTNDEFVYSC